MGAEPDGQSTTSRLGKGARRLRLLLPVLLAVGIIVAVACGGDSFDGDSFNIDQIITAATESASPSPQLGEATAAPSPYSVS